jgi:glycosyltransferase involved in cell wall biosynthesis
MRVLMLSWEYPPHVVGGLGRHVADIVPALTEEGVTVHLVTPRRAGGKPLERAGSLTVHRVDSESESGLDFFTSTVRTNSRLEEVAEDICRREGIQLIHNHDWLTSFAATSLKTKHMLPLLATIHATERGRARGPLGSDLQRSIDRAEWNLTYEAWRVITCSQYMAGEVMGFFGTPADKIDVIPNGVKASQFARRENADPSAFRARYAAADEDIVLYVGRVVAEKGLQVLVEAVPLVLAEHPKAKFIVAGTGFLLPELQKRSLEMGVANKIYFTGFIPDEDRDGLYQVASCAVFPSLYEPFGIVALEAMAARVPVVVSLAGGLQEVVRHSDTGITVYPDNPVSLAWGINHTLARPDWAKQRAENAYQVVLSEFNWPRIARETAAVYSRIMTEQSRAAW